METLRFIRENKTWLSAGVLLTLMSCFGQTFFISIFAGEIRETFALSHGEWGGIYTLGTTASAIVMVWAGGLTDRFRVRVLGPIVLVMLALACLAMARVSAAWALPLVIFGLRFTGQGMLSHIAVVSMSRWFIATRGRAISIAMLGFALGEAVLPLSFVSLLQVMDWRLLWVGAAAATMAAIPVLLLLMRHERTPQFHAQADHAAGMGGLHWTRNQALRHWLFWCMVPAILGPSAFGTAFFFHQVHYTEIKGIAHVTLVAMFPLYTAVAILSAVTSGWALDRFGTARLIGFMQLPMVLGFLVFAAATRPIGIMAGFVLFGLTTGANSTLPNAFWAEFYGTRNLGSVKATAAAVMVLGSAIGPGLTGLGIDMGVGLELQYQLVSIYFILASVLIWVGVNRARVLLPGAA